MTPDDITEPNITGGYLLEIDSWKISGALGGDESEPFALFGLFYTILKKYLLIRLYNTMKNANINTAG